MDDLISRQEAIDVLAKWFYEVFGISRDAYETKTIFKQLRDLPSARPERLTDDDFETIRIHMNAYKESLCCQRRFEEAEEYQRIIDKFIAFAESPSKRKTGKWIKNEDRCGWHCSECMTDNIFAYDWDSETGEYEFQDFYCPHCGAKMEEKTNE